MDSKNNTLHQVYLALGSNLGDKYQHIQNALDQIGQRIGTVVSVSEMYATQPVGFESDNEFVNAACRVDTTLEPVEILTITQAIEREMGRQSKSINRQYADRIIDIDILFCDSKAHLSPDLTLPHPQLHKRMFVLAPLADIAPHLVHPVLNMTISELKQKLETE